MCDFTTDEHSRGPNSPHEASTVLISVSSSSSSIYGMPACSYDVTSILHSVCIPLAPSLLGCRATLMLFYTWARCILGTFFSLPVCCFRVRGAKNKQRALVVHSCVAQHCISHATCLRILYTRGGRTK